MTNSSIKAAFAAVTGMGVLLGGMGAADAVLVQTFGVDHHNGPTTQTLNFDAATPNQSGHGALAQVSIALSTIAVGGGDQATLTGGEGGTSTRGGLTADLAITGTSGALFSGSTTVAASTCTISGTVGCTGTVMSPSQPSFAPATPIIITDGGTMANFVGGPVQLTALISNYNVTPPACDSRNPSLPSTCGGFDNITWAPTVTIAYTYEDVSSVPEPGTIGILGVGGLVLTRLRRRRTVGPRC